MMYIAEKLPQLKTRTNPKGNGTVYIFVVIMFRFQLIRQFCVWKTHVKPICRLKNFFSIKLFTQREICEDKSRVLLPLQARLKQWLTPPIPAPFLRRRRERSRSSSSSCSPSSNLLRTWLFLLKRTAFFSLKVETVLQLLCLNF